jgi:hypothetical protein
MPLKPAGAAVAISAVVPAEPIRSAGSAVPVNYGKYDGRQSAPSSATFAELAAVYRVDLPDWSGAEDVDTYLRIEWAGDVAQLRVDGRTVTDRFWDGSPWLISLRDAGYRPGAEVTVHVLPLAAGSTVSLPPEARDRMRTADGQLLAIDEIEVFARTTWHEEGE